MSYILNIETATTNCSVSLSKNGKTLAIKEDNNASYSHAEYLHVFITNLLKECHLKPNQLSAVAVSKGPGSYTGLRIGVSSAKGFCYALDIPLISVSTLRLLAHQVKGENEGIIIPMLDARRMEVYSCVFDMNYNLLDSVQANILESTSYSRLLDQNKVFFIGTGVEKTKQLIKHENACFISDRWPSSKDMSAISYHLFKNEIFENTTYFEPYYLKDFKVTKPKMKLK